MRNEWLHGQKKDMATYVERLNSLVEEFLALRRFFKLGCVQVEICNKGSKACQKDR